jgi:hypothetical protein
MKHTAHPISGLDGFQEWGALFYRITSAIFGNEETNEESDEF